MNDRFLFRGKRREGKGWIIGDLITAAHKYFIDDYNYRERVEENTVGQCTGLKDKNGRLIFEGDIVKIFNPSNQCYYKCEVSFSHLSFDFMCIDWEMLKGTAIFSRTIFTPSCYEIIGNIHDNPELLRGE